MPKAARLPARWLEGDRLGWENPRESSDTFVIWLSDIPL